MKMSGDLSDIFNTNADMKQELDAFYRAAARGDAAAVTCFLDKCPEAVNLRSDGVKMTALMYAANTGQKEMVQLLLERGADAEIEDRFGGKAERYALVNHRYDVASLIVQWPDMQKEKQKEEEERARKIALEKEIADFSPALKRSLPYKTPHFKL
jgi:hypothetical protein